MFTVFLSPDLTRVLFAAGQFDKTNLTLISVIQFQCNFLETCKLLDLVFTILNME